MARTTLRVLLVAMSTGRQSDMKNELSWTLATQMLWIPPQQGCRRLSFRSLECLHAGPLHRSMRLVLGRIRCDKLHRFCEDRMRCGVRMQPRSYFRRQVPKHLLLPRLRELEHGSHARLNRRQLQSRDRPSLMTISTPRLIHRGTAARNRRPRWYQLVSCIIHTHGCLRQMTVGRMVSSP